MEEGRIVQYGTPEDIILNPANDYVARFVAHMNPLNVMKASSLMTPIAHALPDLGTLELTLDKHMHLIEVRFGSANLTPVNSADLSPEKPPEANHIVIASTETGMREIIDFRHTTGQPVLLADNGKIIGIIGDKEIYRGILRKD